MLHLRFLWKWQVKATRLIFQSGRRNSQRRGVHQTTVNYAAVPVLDREFLEQVFKRNVNVTNCMFSWPRRCYDSPQRHITWRALVPVVQLLQVFRAQAAGARSQHEYGTFFNSAYEKTILLLVKVQFHFCRSCGRVRGAWLHLENNVCVQTKERCCLRKRLILTLTSHL